MNAPTPVIERRNGDTWEPFELCHGMSQAGAESRLYVVRTMYPSRTFRLAGYERVLPRAHVQD